MAIDNQHPDYADAANEWKIAHDAARGEVKVKGAAQTYLPMPSGFASQEDGGVAMYGAYLLRAQFPEITAPSARGMVGLIHRIPAKITLPDKLEPLRQRCTPDGVSLADFHERITSEVLLMGRYGLLADFDEGTAMPYIAGYRALSIINWSKAGDFFVLDETAPELDANYEWNDRTQFRELRLAGGSTR